MRSGRRDGYTYPISPPAHISHKPLNLRLPGQQHGAPPGPCFCFLQHLAGAVVVGGWSGHAPDMPVQLGVASAVGLGLRVGAGEGGGPTQQPPALALALALSAHLVGSPSGKGRGAGGTQRRGRGLSSVEGFKAGSPERHLPVVCAFEALTMAMASHGHWP